MRSPQDRERRNVVVVVQHAGERHTIGATGKLGSKHIAAHGARSLREARLGKARVGARGHGGKIEDCGLQLRPTRKCRRHESALPATDIQQMPATPERNSVEDVVGEWDRAYGREQALYPLPTLRTRGYFPPVSRIDAAYGDRNLVCTCGPIEAYADSLVSDTVPA